MSIASFFGICVWLVPFTYFISLSANDNALPSFDQNQQANKQKKAGILKTLFGAILNKKDSTPTIIETPKYPGFGSNSLGSSTHMHQNQHLSTPTPMTGAPSSRPSSPYAFNPEKNYNRPDYISRPNSSNSNHSNFGTPRQQSYQGNNNSESSPMNSYTGGSGQTYASSSSVYTHSGSTVGSRF